MALTLESLKPIYPKYDYMRTDNPKEVCCTYLNDKNRFNVPPLKGLHHIDTASDVQQEVFLRRVDWRGRARGLYYHYQPGEPKLVTSPIDKECKPKPPVICRGRTRTRCTQTHYRESSAQTRSYQPEVAGDKEVYQGFEVYQIAQLIDSLSPPGEYEAKVVERHRRRQKFKKALALVPEDKVKQRAILEAMEWEEWIAREEDIQNCQMVRMEIVTRIFKQREEKMHQDSEQRILVGTERVQARRVSQLKKININYARGIRRLEGDHQKLIRRYRKGNITTDHTDPTSELHAPQMRFGVNPNRRHFVGFKKHFDERIEELEKQLEEKEPAGFVCPFTKLRTWAKPKQRMLEVTQRFCSDENLKNLYESLKGLRTLAEAPKPTPDCLKKKKKSPRPRPTQEADKQSVQMEHDMAKLNRVQREEAPKVEVVKSEPINQDKLAKHLLLRRSKELITRSSIKVNGIVAEFEGANLGKLLQFLNDEMLRLKHLKKFQAIQMLATKERWRREACEAGLRQKENHAREQHEEFYEVSAQTHKDTACLFLESILEEEFEYTADELASEKILELAKTIDERQIHEIMLHDKEKKRYFRDTVRDYIRNQLFVVAEKILAKQRSQQLTECELKALEEELFKAIKQALEDEHQTPESISLVGEILDNVIADSVTYDFGDFTPDTSDEEFDTEREIEEVIKKLISIAVRHPGHKPCFTDLSDYNLRLEAERETRAIIRKMIRRTITEQRWKNEGDRIIEQTVSETFNNAVNEVECMRASRMVQADERLKIVIEDIFKNLSISKQVRMTIRSDSSLESPCSGLHSVSSAFDIFDKPSKQSDESEPVETVVYPSLLSPLTRIDYVDPRMLNFYEPPTIDRRHERFDIMGRVAKRWEEENNIPGVSTESDTSSNSSQFARISYETYFSQMGLSKILLTPWIPSIHPHMAVKQLASGKRLSRSFERDISNEPAHSECDNPPSSRRHSF